MGHAGASEKSPNAAPWEMLSLRLSRLISAPLLTAVCHGDMKKNCFSEAAGLSTCFLPVAA